MPVVDLYEAHVAAIWSGRTHSFARFWKRKGEGQMTAKDREHGYSYESSLYIVRDVHVCGASIDAFTELGGSV